MIFEELNSNNIFINTLILELVKIEDDDDNIADEHLDPVTVILRLIAKKDKIEGFEKWL